MKPFLLGICNELKSIAKCCRIPSVHALDSGQLSHGYMNCRYIYHGIHILRIHELEIRVLGKHELGNGDTCIEDLLGIPLHVYVLTIHVLKFGIHELRIPGTCILDTCIVDTCIYDTCSSQVAL